MFIRDVLDLTQEEACDPSNLSVQSQKSASNSPTQATLPSSPQPSTSTAASATMTSKTISMLTIIQIIENLILLGYNSIEKYQTLVKELLNCDELLSDVCLLQLVYLIKSIVDFGCSQIMSTENNAEVEVYAQCLSFDEIISLWMPFIQRKNIISKTFTFDVVQKLFAIIRSINCEQEKKEFMIAKYGPDYSNLKQLDSSSTKQNKCKKRKQKILESSDEDTSNEGVNDFECDSLFSKFFDQKRKHPIIVSQQFQFVSGDERKKITTPGEQGTHLVKIEITDTRDLQTCKGEKFYWQKVAKKGLFLIDVKKNETDKKMYDNLLTVLSCVGEKLSKIKNAKFESVSIENNRK